MYTAADLALCLDEFRQQAVLLRLQLITLLDQGLQLLFLVLCRGCCVRADNHARALQLSCLSGAKKAWNGPYLSVVLM